MRLGQVHRASGLEKRARTPQHFSRRTATAVSKLNAPVPAAVGRCRIERVGRLGVTSFALPFCFRGSCPPSRPNARAPYLTRPQDSRRVAARSYERDVQAILQADAYLGAVP